MCPGEIGGVEGDQQKETQSTPSHSIHSLGDILGSQEAPPLEDLLRSVVTPPEHTEIKSSFTREGHSYCLSWLLNAQLA